MPLITLTVRQSATTETINTLLASAHSALVSVGVPQNDVFQRVHALPREHFRFDATYPDLTTPRDERFALVEIVWSVGRSVKVKRLFLKNLMDALTGHNINPDHVMVVFIETQWENWSFSGGRQIHA